MARTKISEFSATPASNTDIDSINIAEGCAPSGINDAIRELMSQLKDFQTGAVGDSFNGPVGTTTAAAGAFTTLAASGAVTLSGGTANGVTYLNGSKVLTSGSALTFDGAILGVNGVTVGRGAGAVATNTAIGSGALATNATGAYNTAVGNGALSTSTGDFNTAIGRASMLATTTGIYNTAVGGNTLTSNTTGTNNTAIGLQALTANTTASNNTAVGFQAGLSNTTGANNTVMGFQAGYGLTTGARNTFVGAYNGSNGSGRQITTGSANTILGGYDGNQGGLDIRTASNYIVLSDGDGFPAFRLSSAEGVYMAYVKSGAGTNALKWNTTTGYVTYDTSSARYKDNIRDSVYGIDAVMAMRSTQFEYKDDGRSDVGLIAEELDLIVPELVGKNADGEPDSVSYDRMVSVLVKAIQEQQAIITALTARIETLEGK